MNIETWSSQHLVHARFVGQSQVYTFTSIQDANEKMEMFFRKGFYKANNQLNIFTQ